MKAKVCLIRLIFLLHAVSCGFGWAAGVAITKKQEYHKDSSAEPFVFSSVEDKGHFLVFTQGSKTFNIEKTSFIRYVEVPSSIPQTITSSQQVDFITKKAEELRRFSEKYPRSEPILAQHIQTLNAVVDQLNDGNVRVEGEWIHRSEHRKRIADANAEAKERAKREMAELQKRREERRAFEAAQREKGLVEYRGDWMTPERAAEKRSEDELNAKISRVLKERSIAKSVIRIFQNLDEGALCSIIRGRAATSRTDFCYLRDVTMTAEDELYEGDLYYSGTYSYINKLGDRRTVAAYCVDKQNAISHLRSSLGGGRGRVNHEERSGDSPRSALPEVLDFARAFGSGFFVGDKGHVVTNHHVVRGSKKVCIFHKGKLSEAEVVAVSAVSDLAILKLDYRNQGVPLSPEELESGEEIFALGFPQPQIQGTELKITKGIISSKSGMKNHATSYQIDAAIQPGNSGGPICAPDGRAVGVVVAKLNEVAVANQTGSLPQNVNYAIKSTEVLALLRSKGIKVAEPDGSQSLQSSKGAVCLVAVQ